ncbi:MAG: PTS sugar transporter subunit IIA [Gammaproteobacteria bacterium]|nr:PTS sugar transporter subunit IIA [Gammaproteobacteria bacterium]
MSVALLLITHKKIASSLVEVASSIVNDAPENFACIEVPMDAPVDAVETRIDDQLNKLDRNDGLMILTDMYGGTPSNIANKYLQQEDTYLISGLNLPMLVKIMNYRNLPLAELSEKVLSGGKQGIELHTK